MKRTMIRKRSARRDDSYEENVTDTEKAGELRRYLSVKKYFTANMTGNVRLRTVRRR